MKENVIKISFQNDRATIASEEHETSAEEWNQLRKNAFSQLRKDEFIPDELIDLAEGFKERTPVQLFGVRNGDEVQLCVRVIEDKPKQTVAQQLAEIRAAAKSADENNDTMTASEALALFLRLSLRKLKIAEKKRGKAPARSLNFSPRSLIGEIALDLLESCNTWNYAPGHELNGLVRELLNLQSYKQGASRAFDAREEAIWITAQQPDIGVRALAREVNVNASTVRQWRKDPDFNERVQRQTERNNTLKTRGSPLDKAMRILEERKRKKGI